MIACTAIALAAAATPVAAPCKPIPRDANWRAAATQSDRTRLHDWRDAFVKALDEAKAGGNEADVVREGVLLQPDAALPAPALPPGTYACRTIKLGSQRSDGLRYVAYRPFTCRVTATGLEKIDGSQRPTGRLFAAEDRQQVFLGTMVLADEARAIAYGRDADRDMAGLVERVGPKRWRLVLPYPRFESTLDVIELVPAS